jgi:ADP-heptose:LPS heptosyltransferase
MINEYTPRYVLSTIWIYHRLRWFSKRILDIITFIIISQSYLFPQKKIEKKNIKKILVINLQGIGDLIMTSVLIESLKKSFDCKIDILGMRTTKNLYSNDKRIKHITYDGFFSSLFKIRKRNYDIVICAYRAEHAGLLTALSDAKHKIGYIYSLGVCSNNIKLYEYKNIKTRDTKIRSDILRRALNLDVSTDYENIQVYTDKKDEIKISKILNRYNGNDIIVFNCNNQWISRSWPTKYWIELGKKFSEGNKIIFLIGTINDYQYNQHIKESIGDYAINISGDLNITETTELLKRSKIFITTDSGPMHMGFAAKTNVISLFGSTDPKMFVPKKYMPRVLWKNRTGNLCPLFNYNNEPITNNNNCMKAISVNDVTNLYNKLIR